MSERRIVKPKLSSEKDSSGAFVPRDLSMDSLLSKGLEAIYCIIHNSCHMAASGQPTRESVMNLKDAMSMLHELKKQEKDIIAAMSEEELLKAASDAD